MNIYITYGTNDYLHQVRENHSNEIMLILTGEEDQALLLHETGKETIFKEGKHYEILDQSGILKESGFAILNNIPVSDEGRTLFEYRFKNRARMIENEPGFGAIRVLRPLNSDTYIIFTQWESKQDFLNWQNSKAYDTAHKKRGTSEGIDQQSIFPRPSYVTKYSILTNQS
ncbi:antibiotic biosynthesis monooxygenase family protein [Bacillus sp. DJP31]|uniref:antibiotic biosynthesis monooxygenase family protein n=1 Tax=Bacillus sp. DJP31 TaxID=3409789 RepID=UPI003BB6ABFD